MFFFKICFEFNFSALRFVDLRQPYNDTNFTFSSPWSNDAERCDSFR